MPMGNRLFVATEASSVGSVLRLRDCQQVAAGNGTKADWKRSRFDPGLPLLDVNAYSCSRYPVSKRSPIAFQLDVGGLPANRRVLRQISASTRACDRKAGISRDDKLAVAGRSR